MSDTKISIGIPSYNRIQELDALLESIFHQETSAEEVLICEDNSPARLEIRKVVNKYKSKFDSISCNLTYIENEQNLGYDANIRKVIEKSSGDYVMIMGDDDLLLYNAIKDVKLFLDNNVNIKFISRAFIRFDNNSGEIINKTWLSEKNFIYKEANSSGGIIFRLCGFVGGLIVKKDWAVINQTNKYDGGLYYQYYLASRAYLENGIGYISTPIVAGRAGNSPLFGVSKKEKAVHIPGSYTPEGRARMWQTILEITKDIDEEYKKNLLKPIKYELANRQSFHIFEAMPQQGRKKTIKLLKLLNDLGLVRSLPPIIFTLIIIIFGVKSKYLFTSIRRFQYLIESKVKIKI